MTADVEGGGGGLVMVTLEGGLREMVVRSSKPLSSKTLE